MFRHSRLQLLDNVNGKLHKTNTCAIRPLSARSRFPPPTTTRPPANSDHMLPGNRNPDTTGLYCPRCIAPDKVLASVFSKTDPSSKTKVQRLEFHV